MTDERRQLLKVYGQAAVIDDRKEPEALLVGERQLLEMIATGQPLPAVLDALCHLVEAVTGQVCSILLVDEDGKKMRHGAAPSIDPAYTRALDGSEIGEHFGPCSMATHLNEQVIVADMASDERFPGYRELALTHGLRSSWSVPILSPAGVVLGSFALYRRTPGLPPDGYRSLMDQFTALASIAVERSRGEAALRRRKEELQQIMASVSDCLWSAEVSADGKLVYRYYSPVVERIAGRPPQHFTEARGRWSDIVHPDDSVALETAFERIFNGATAHEEAEYRILRPDGAIRWVRDSMLGTRLDDGRIALSGVLSDITERREAEAELERLEGQLRRAQRLEAMGKLAGGIAHDFNNILGAVLGYGEMALRDVASGTRLRRDLESIMLAGERGRSLVDRILSFSRSGMGERVAVDVRHVVSEALEMLKAGLPSDINVAADLQSGSAAVLGDPAQIHQIFMNLATNAIQAMSHGGTLRVTLRAETVRERYVGVIGTVQGPAIILAVADEGCGIPAEIIDRIFDPFFTTKDAGVGTGLGLSLVHGIVRDLDGSIGVSTTVGLGSCFTIHLPRIGDAAAQRRGKPTELPRGRGQRILIVDDEEPLLRLAAENVTGLGYEALPFASSIEALRVVRASPEEIDAVITDERMPGMSGTALIREIRSIRSDIPVVLVSGYLSPAETAQARRTGADEVLMKPLSRRDLATGLSRVLPP